MCLVPNNRAPNYMREKLVYLQEKKKNTDEATIIVGDFNIPLSEMDRLTIKDIV